jgi:predicted dehydrogenase
MADYRAGIIGLGFIGAGDQVSGDALGQRVEDLDGTHASSLAGHPRIELVAGSSRDQGRRDRFAQRTGARTYADWRELLEREELDIVSVATYANVHADPTVACAEAGVRAVLCEKPIAQSVPDAERMVAACADAGALLVVNHQRRFNSSFRRARAHLAAGGIGELTSINAQWPTGRLGGVGSHVLDTIYHVTGRRIEAVSATLDLAGKPDARGPQFADPGGWGTLRFEGGVMGTVDATDYGMAPWDVRVNGAEGRALVGSDDVTIEYWDGRTEHFTNDDQDGNGMDVAVREMVGWLDGESDFPYDPAETVQVLEAIAAFHVSHARNAAWVELPLTGADREIVVNSG